MAKKNSRPGRTAIGKISAGHENELEHLGGLLDALNKTTEKHNKLIDSYLPQYIGKQERSRPKKKGKTP